MTMFKRVMLCVGVVGVFAGPAFAGPVDMSFSPTAQVANVGANVQINILLSSNSGVPESVSALDAILDWDSSLLQLTGVTNAMAGYSWLVEGFLPDPDGINANLGDGNAIYTGLGQLAAPAFAPPAPATLIVTTLEFTALAPTPGTLVRFVPAMGIFGQTQIFAGFVANTPVTGDISGTALVTIVPEPASVWTIILGVCAVCRRIRPARRITS
ncbi:MAG: hypothetical protein HZA51_11985 [Planctomycetes bacterium]|nr:hypothetical protein [Planctomycetota bacterium]